MTLRLMKSDHKPAKDAPPGDTTVDIFTEPRVGYKMLKAVGHMKEEAVRGVVARVRATGHHDNSCVSLPCPSIMTS